MRTGSVLASVVVITLATVFTAPTPSRSVGQRFFRSLRLAKPERVSVNIPSFTGATANRQLQNLVASIITDKASVMLDETDRPVPSAEAASRLAGFAARLPGARKDPPVLTVTGAHAVDLRISRSQLQTILRQAGRPSTGLAPSLEGAVVTMRTPRAVRVQYGHCPVLVDTTLQGQIQGPPPVSAENGDCVVLTESPAPTVSVPSGLDVVPLLDIALELSGMSPNQVQVFRTMVDWQSSLALSLPRFMRSYDTVTVGDARGMLVTTAGRRGPAYELIWARNGIVYALAGYGNAADAVPLANSTN